MEYPFKEITSEGNGFDSYNYLQNFFHELNNQPNSIENNNDQEPVNDYAEYLKASLANFTAKKSLSDQWYIDDAIEAEKKSHMVNTYIRPIFQGLGTVGGSLLGVPFGIGAGSLGTGALGAGIGYSFSNRMADKINNFIGGTPIAHGSLYEEAIKTAYDVGVGASMEVGGALIGQYAPYVRKLAQAAMPTVKSSASKGAASAGKLLEETDNFAKNFMAKHGIADFGEAVSAALGKDKFHQYLSSSPAFRKYFKEYSKYYNTDESKRIYNFLNYFGKRKAINQYDDFHNVKYGSDKSVTEASEITAKQAEIPQTQAVQNINKVNAEQQIDNYRNIAEANGWVQPESLKSFVTEAVKAPQGRNKAAFVGVLPQNVTRFIETNTMIKLDNPMVAFTEGRIKHALREFKVSIGKAATPEEIASVAKKIMSSDTRWFYDTQKNNVVFAFVRDGDEYIKVPVYLNRKIYGNKGNEIATAGKVDKNNLRQDNLIEIR